MYKFGTLTVGNMSFNLPVNVRVVHWLGELCNLHEVAMHLYVRVLSNSCSTCDNTSRLRLHRLGSKLRNVESQRYAYPRRVH